MKEALPVSRNLTGKADHSAAGRNPPAVEVRTVTSTSHPRIEARRFRPIRRLVQEAECRDAQVPR
jgi:hypothetical protein